MSPKPALRTMQTINIVRFTLQSDSSCMPSCDVSVRSSGIPGTPTTAAACVFGIVELLEIILANFELLELHILQGVDPSFRQTIRTSPVLRRIALGDDDNRIGRHHRLLTIIVGATFTVCDKGSRLRNSGVSSSGMKVRAMITLVCEGSRRVDGFWREILLHAIDFDYDCFVGRQDSAGPFMLMLGPRATLGDLVDAVL
ncbi:hypothetical protein LTR78_009935 [Recurvomyces mirabilis]|uniref:Uncharacterized protein n=1 Tax=Recurvomyces mirabilis TaxID=574656 RepID=A0AAE0WGD3_9PEZI|nr:hypothetical protein LTR78_009935 [Recurvomyces mirabilis]KAK5160367.1 hypothetical protein LTS14_001379 [Recurvomyces mirabilis]